MCLDTLPPKFTCEEHSPRVHLLWYAPEKISELLQTATRIVCRGTMVFFAVKGGCWTWNIADNVLRYISNDWYSKQDILNL